MSIDFEKIAEVGLRNLYLQMLDMYVSALKNPDFSSFNNAFLDVFDQSESANVGDFDIFSEESVQDFIAKNIRSTTSAQEVKDLLNKQYNLFGVDTPSGGFLNIYSGASSWWKSSSEKLPSGYFSHVEVFDYDGSKIKSITDSSKSFAFNINNGSIGSGLNNFLIQKTKDSYIDSDDGDLNSVYIDLDKVSDKFFFILNEAKNSFHYQPGTPGKVYIRIFFNEFGASLNYDSVKIEGIKNLAKIPSGIKKNFLLKNFYSGIDAFKKEFTKDSDVTPTKMLLEDFDKLKELVKKIAQKKKLKDNSRISFVFFDDYRFQSFLDKNNAYIGTKQLKQFLRENTNLNRQIASLNQTNCLLGGKDRTDSAIGIGNSPDEYSHFSSNNESYKKQSNKQKAKIYQASRSAWKYIGDLTLKTAYEYIRKQVPGGNKISEMYRQFLNFIDVTALAIDAATEAAKKIPLPDVRRIYFEVFIQQLDITELLDCVVSQAGESIFVSYSGGDINDLEFELKVLLYNRFRFFYNTAKSFDPVFFNYISDEEGLPDANINLTNIRSYAAAIDSARKQGDSKKEEQLKKDYLSVLAQKDDINKIFQYISMIPEEQLSSIYTTITSNEPQYQYLPNYINRGMLKARDFPGFSSDNFIQSLFKVSIIEYSRSISGFDFLSLYDNLSKKNKKLKTNKEIEKEDPRNFADIGDSAKKAKTKLHEPINFDWFTARYETYDIEKAFINALEMAWQMALEQAISELIKMTTELIFKLIAGDEEAFDNVDPSIKQELASNDPTENLINAPLTDYSSPKELYNSLKNEVFGANATGDVECLLNKISAEIPPQLQFKYLKDMIAPDNISLLTMKNFFKECGFNSSYQSITTFFRWLNFELEKSGGMAALLDKINFFESMISTANSICDSSLESQDGIPNQIILNEIEAAKKNLSDMLTISDTGPSPVLFGCSDSSDNQAVFKDYYTPIEKQCYDALMKMILQSINDIYNSDISKFKSIILKEGNSISNNQSVLDPDQNTGYAEFREQNVSAALGQSDSEETDTLSGKLSKDQKSLSKIINDIFSKNQFFLESAGTTTETLPNGLIVYSFTTAGILYQVFVNATDTLINSTDTVIPTGDVLQFSPEVPPNSTVIVAKGGPTSSDIIYTETINSAYDITENFITIINGYSSTSTDISGIQEYYNIDELQQVLYSEILNNFLIPGGEENTKKAFIVVDSILNSAFFNLINNVNNFYSTQTFLELPLKDKEASVLQDPTKNKYRDNGLLATDELLDNYKVSRKNYQCFIGFDETPEPQQLSKLRALYQSLFNVLIMEGLLSRFLNLNENFDLSEDKILEKVIADGVIKAFKTSITSVGNLKKGFEDDINLLYKLETLEDKFTAGSTIINKTELTTIEDKIAYLSNKNFESILERLKSRINLVQPNTLNKTVVDSLKGYTVHDIYDDIAYEDNVPYPVINDLQRGLIIQNYIDIRQNGQIFQEYKENPKDLFKVLPFVTNTPGLGQIIGFNEDEAGGNTGESVFGFGNPTNFQNISDSNSVYPIGSAFQGDIFGNYKAFPVYSEGFFKSIYANYITVDMNFTTDEGDTDIDIFENYISVKESEFFTQWDWRNVFINTQGKISKKDFENHYKFLNTNTDESPSDPLFVPYYTENGPEQYYKKASIGARMSLVIDLDNTEGQQINAALNNELQNLVSVYENYLGKNTQSPVNSVQAREIIKEKIGIYKNQDGKKFLVIPLYELNNNTITPSAESLLAREKNVLQEVSQNYIQNSQTEWWDSMYNKLVNEPFDAIDDALKKTFFEFFPISVWKELLPLVIEEAIFEEYGDEILNIFDKTKKEILKRIEEAKSFMEDDFIKDPQNEEPDFSGDSLNIGLIILQMIAGLVDPTWKTNWFAPGPLTPIGFAAKILTAAEEDK